MYKFDAEETEAINALCRQKGWRFDKGIFLSENDWFNCMLGYGTALDFIVNFSAEHEYAGPAYLSIPERTELLSSPIELSKISESKHHIKEVNIPEKGLDFKFRISANHLNDPPVQGKLISFYGPSSYFVSAKGMKKIPEIEQLLDKYNVKRTGNFGWNEVYAILEGMKEFEYSWDRAFRCPPSEFIKLKKGVCGQFAELFCHLVYAAGGISRLKGGQPLLNLKSMGKNIYLKTGGTGEDHEWAEVYLDNKFQVIDPTFYINTSKGYWDDSKEFWENLAKRFVNGQCNHAYVLRVCNPYLAKDKEGRQCLKQKVKEIKEI